MRGLRFVVAILLGAAGVATGAPVSGRVVDTTGKPVAGAIVTVDFEATLTVDAKIARGTTTDANGRFAIDAPIGASVLVMKDGFGVGLGNLGHDIVLVSIDASGETRGETRGEVIEIRGETAPGAQGSVKLSRQDVERIPGTGNDIVRSLQAMPGIVSYPLPLGNAGVVIRGSSPQDSKVLIDDFEVPALYHDIGFRSIVPAEAIESLEYTPGGFDVAYGRAASGIVSLTTRAGNGHAQQVEGSLSELGLLAQGETKRTRMMVAFRRSTIDYLLPALLPDDLDLALTTVPRYYDEQVRVDYKPSTAWNVRASSLGSDDALELYASKDRNEDKRFFNRTRFLRLTAAASYHDRAWTVNLALSGMALQTTFERGLYQHLDVVSPSLTTRIELARTIGATVIRFGGENVVTNHRIDLALPGDRREGEPLEPDNPMDTSTKFIGTVTTTDIAAWSALSADLDKRIRFTGGLRIDAYRKASGDRPAGGEMRPSGNSSRRDIHIQPRGELAVKLAPALLARFSAGAYSRPAEHQTELLDPAIGAELATQLITGVAYTPVDGLRAQASIYWTDRRRLITREMDELTNNGRGTTYGAEVLATVNRGPYLGWFSYAYSHSTRVDTPGAERRLFDYDQPHNLNIAGSYKRGRWQFGARFRASSGLPMTPVELGVFDSDANIHYPVFGEVNSDRAPLHHQLDIRIDKTWMWGPVKMTKFLDVQNVYMNDSVVTYFYGFDYTQRAAFRSLPILPTAGLRGEW